MQGLTYLKKLEHRKQESWTGYIFITLFIFLFTLAIYYWGYGNGLREGMSRVDATVSKALKGGYDVGVEKGLDALEVKRK